MPTQFLPLPELTAKFIWRFWCYTDTLSLPTKDKCILWTGGRNGGIKDKYKRPYYRVGEDHYIAARVAWKIYYKQDPGNIEVCHNCPGGDNIMCVNPLHMYLGSHQQNCQDIYDKGGKPSYGRTRKSPEEVRAIRKMYKEGVPVGQIAEVFEICRGQVYQLGNYRQQRHILD